MLERELSEFGRRMGLQELAFGQNGLVALDVERLGRLHLEKNERAGRTELLVYLARPCPAHDRQAPERALALCHYRHPRPFPLSAGVHGDQAIVLTRLPEREATAANLEKAVLLLADAMRTLAPEV